LVKDSTVSKRQQAFAPMLVALQRSIWCSVAALMIATAAAAAAAEPTIALKMLADGSIEIEGERVAGLAAQNAKLREIASRTPKPSLVLMRDQDIGYEAVVNVLIIVQMAGLRIESVAAPP
jgi:biopolymer transport protein ExbD